MATYCFNLAASLAVSFMHSSSRVITRDQQAKIADTQTIRKHVGWHIFIFLIFANMLPSRCSRHMTNMTLTGKMAAIKKISEIIFAEWHIFTSLIFAATDLNTNKLSILDYFLGISEASCTLLKRNNMGLPFYANDKHQICFNAKHLHEYLIDYITKYLDAIADNPQIKPLFSYTTTHVSHDDVGIRVQTLDVHLRDFIKKLSTMENTLSILFADHGNTYTSYQAYEDGKQEMYHPYMLMVVPKTMGRTFGDSVLRNLHENQRRLFTLFDIRAGLVELARWVV